MKDHPLGAVWQCKGASDTASDAAQRQRERAVNPTLSDADRPVGGQLAQRAHSGGLPCVLALLLRQCRGGSRVDPHLHTRAHTRARRRVCLSHLARTVNGCARPNLNNRVRKDVEMATGVLRK